MSNYPLVATLKQGCIVLNSDMSYSNHIRKPNMLMLKQNNSNVYTKTRKQLMKVETLGNSFEDINAYAEAHNTLHMAHIKHNESKGYEVAPLGLLSKSQLSKIRKAVENMTATVVFNSDSSKKSSEREYYLSFVTLTLPYKQLHTDAVIRKKALLPFMDNLRKTYGVKHYIWKAEPQKNGNIHFHIIIDKFIHYEQIRALWNRQMGKLGYLDKYANKRKKEGFIYKPFYYKKGVKEASKLSFEEQKAYFELEESQGFKNPNSTDVKKLNNIEDTCAYIMKYMDKQEVGKRPIIGKLWGLSNLTKKLDYPKIREDEPLFNQVIHLISNNDLKVVLKDDFFSVHAGRIHEIAKKRYQSISSEIKNHYKKISEFTLETYENVKSKAKQLYEDSKKIIMQPIVVIEDTIKTVTTQEEPLQLKFTYKEAFE